MKFSKITQNLDIQKIAGRKDGEITDVVTDTRLLSQGCVFLCIRGFKVDGHAFFDTAVEGGARAVIVDDPAVFEEKALQYRDKTDGGELLIALVPWSRHALAVVSDNFWGHPSGDLNLIGVTGTKGKTTTSLMIKHIYDCAGVKTGLVGTMYNMVGEEIVPTDRTTPEANVLQPLLRRMADSGVKTCVMEASSQGLKLERVGGCAYNLAVFTNLTPDHIGATEHPDMEDYANSKAKIFQMCRKGLFNADSPYFERIKRDATCEVYTYAIDSEADFMARNVTYGSDFVEYDLCGICPTTRIRVRIPGKFSVYNSLAAAGVCFLDGGTPEQIAAGVGDIVVKGKAEIVPTGRDFTVMIDYAHNPDSFINIISTVKAFARRTVFLFGAGGDRNRPRALMGETAATYADFTIITSDNPRTEDPAKIVADIEAGAKKTGKPYVSIVDRRQAIWYAIENAEPGDVIILAGKGHETTQIFKDRTVEFDERKIVKEALAEIYGK